MHSIAQQSKAHSGITSAQLCSPGTCRSECVSEEACTYTHAASGLFCLSMELMAFASRLFAPNMLDHLLHLSSQSILPCEREYRAEPLATRSALCAVHYNTSSPTVEGHYSVVKPHALPNKRRGEKKNTPKKETPEIEASKSVAGGVKATCLTTRFLTRLISDRCVSTGTTRQETSDRNTW